MFSKSLVIFIFLILRTSTLQAAGPSSLTPFLPGETITYDIKKIGMKVGEAQLTFHGLKRINGHDCNIIVFVSKAVQFYDKETICLEPDTFLPLMVKRDLNIFGKKESILEEYLRKEGKIKITNHAGDRTEENVIRKSGNVENIYGFIYRYRQRGTVQKGELIKMILPTKDVQMEAMEKQDMSIGNKHYNAYFLQSSPRQFNVWFDDSSRKIPLRIDGSSGLGKTSMILKNYKEF